MSSSRRSFLARLSAAAAALSATFALPRSAGAEPLQSHDLDKWLDDLKGQHKMICDCVTKTHISEMAFARNFLQANGTDYGLNDSDSSVIVSLRHEATPFGFNDAMWEKYKIGESLDVPARAAGRGGAAGAATDTTRAATDSIVPKATRNPQLTMITTLSQRGALFTVCGMATQRYAGEYARKTNQQMADVRAELLANLVPNGRPVAAGVIVINRAQERGFSLLYVG